MSEPAEAPTPAPKSRVRRFLIRLGAAITLLASGLTIAANTFESVAKMVEATVKVAKSKKDLCEVIFLCQAQPESGAVVQSPSASPAPSPPAQTPTSDPATGRPPADGAARNALTTTKQTPPEAVESSRDTSFDTPRQGRIVTAASEERVSLCGRPDVIVFGPERNGTDQVQLRRPGALPSERRDVAVALNVPTDIGAGCIIRVTRSGDRRPLYAFEEIVR